MKSAMVMTFLASLVACAQAATQGPECYPPGGEFLNHGSCFKYANDLQPSAQVQMHAARAIVSHRHKHAHESSTS